MRRPPVWRCVRNVIGNSYAGDRDDLIERPACAGAGFQCIGQSARQSLGAGPGDDRAVVGAQFRRRRDQRGAGIERDAFERVADRTVGGDAARGHQRGRIAETLAEHPQAGDQAVVDDVHDGGLKCGAQVGHVQLRQRRDLLRLEPQGGLEAGEREVGLGASEHRPRQREAARVAAQRLPLDLRSARITETEQLRDLVVGFADGIVDGGAEAHIVADVARRDDLGVAARGEEQAVGEFDCVGEARRQGVRFEVIDRHQRFLGDQRNRLGGGEPDDDPADQAGAGRRRDAVELPQADVGVDHRLGDDVVDDLDMGARRDLRHHAAIGGVLVRLRQHDVGQDFAAPVIVALHDGSGGFVARGLDAEDQHQASVPESDNAFAPRPASL